MATGINFSETMTPSNIVFEPVVNKAEGIRAESNLNTVATLLKVGGAGAIDYAKYKTEEEAKKQVEKTIEEYDPSSPSKTIENQNIAYNLEQKITNPETNPVEVPGFIDSLKETNRKLLNAKEQGNMTALEFETRVSKEARALASRNPVFSSEIYKATQSALEGANMSARLKFDTKAIEDVRQAKKDRETRLENASLSQKIEIPYFSGTYTKDYDTFEKNLNENTKSERLFVEMKRNKEKVDLISDKQIRNLDSSGVISGIVKYRVQQAYSDALNEIDNVKNIADLPYAITKVFKDAQFDLKESFSTHANNPIIKGHFDAFDKVTDAMIASLKDKKTGKDMTDSLKQTKDMLTTAQEINVIKELNVPKLKTIEILNTALKNVNDPAAKNILLKLLTYESNTLMNDQVLFQDITKSKNGIPSIHTTATTITIKAAETDPSLYPVIKQFLQFGTDATKREDSNLTERTQALENLMTIYADPKSKDISKMTDPKMKADQNKTIESYIAYTIQGIKQENTRFRDSSVVVKNKLFIDGTMYAEGCDDKYQSIVVNKVNTALKAYANFYGKDTKDIAQEFYQKYFSGVFINQGTQNENQTKVPAPNTNTVSPLSGGGANKKADLISSAFIPKFISSANAGEVDQIVTRLIDKESKGQHINPVTRQLVESPKGAKGITQIMPATGIDPGYGVEPLKNNTEQEYKRFGRDYFVAMLNEFNGDAAKALAAYNYGPINVKALIKNHGNIWFTKLPNETKDYVASIL
jgi:hypothetical protein